jgi:hypothetical protein
MDACLAHPFRDAHMLSNHGNVATEPQINCRWIINRMQSVTVFSKPDVFHNIILLYFQYCAL